MDADLTNYGIIEADGVNDCYLQTVKSLVQFGDIVVSRGMETKEVRPVVLILSDPRKRFLTCPGRWINPYFQVMEAIWILSGGSSVEWISYYLKDIEKYSDGEKEFHAPYGKRIRDFGAYRDAVYTLRSVVGYPPDQLKNCFDYLDIDPDTRHALVTLWNPAFDNIGMATIDRPCNFALHFLIRESALQLTVYNRSNDIHLGLFNANVVQFSVILEALTMCLGRPLGKQIHLINSLHFYTDSPITSRILAEDLEKRPFSVYDYVAPKPFWLNFRRYKDLGMNYSNYQILDIELKKFMALEQAIRNGDSEEIVENYTRETLFFNFLIDAIFLALSYRALKKGDLSLAFMCLDKVVAADIFISCLEYLVRKGTKENLISPEVIIAKAMIHDHFSFLGPEKIAKIDEYIFHH